MQILINSDHNVHGGDTATATVESVVHSAVDRFATRIEVHLSDTNGPKHGDHAKRCVMEARIAGVRPLAVAHEAPHMLQAVEGAAEKLKRTIEHTLGRMEEPSG